MFRELMVKIINGENLTREEISSLFSELLSGNLKDTQIAAFMAALAAKGETFEELAGAAEAMRKKAARIQTTAGTVVDTCGTGGDGMNTFNISTVTAFVVAGCGVTVAKHGNRSVSSKCGSADLLEALGVRLDTPPEIVEEAIAEIGIGFLFAPVYHSAMKHAVKARTEVGVRSIFNMLGPLSNPAAANCQLLGVYDPKLTEMFAQALKFLKAKRAIVVHGHDGLDEISICAPTRISELRDDSITTFDVNPEDWFGETADPESLKGGDAEANAETTKKILSGETGPRQNIVLINAAAALTVADKATDFREGLELARESIKTGAAMEKLNKLIEFTQENG